jgi:hypothetical protein
MTKKKDDAPAEPRAGIPDRMKRDRLARQANSKKKAK